MLLISLIKPQEDKAACMMTCNDLECCCKSSVRQGRRGTARFLLMGYLASIISLLLPTPSHAFVPGNGMSRRQPPTPRLFSSKNSNNIPSLDKWMVLPDGRVLGTVQNHATYPNGAVIATAPLAAIQNNNPPATAAATSVDDENDNDTELIQTDTGSQYYLLQPNTNRQEIQRYEAMARARMNGQEYIEDENIQMEMQLDDKADDKDNDKDNLMQKVKDAGVAGAISYAAWEVAFWTASIPVGIVAYRQVTGHWPDLQNTDDIKQLGAEAFAFVNLARFAVPLRIGLALGTTPWVQRNLVDRFSKKNNNNKATTANN